MRDVLFVLALIGFFAAAAAYVRACIAIVGTETVQDAEPEDATIESEAAA